MPIYVYACKNGHKSERYAHITAADEPKASSKCPECGKKAELIPAPTGKPRFKKGIGGFASPNA